MAFTANISTNQIPTPGLPTKTGSPQPTTSSDALSQLNQFVFGGVALPLVFFKETGTQSIVAHEYPNVNAARVENTGMKPRIFTCKGILTNNIFPGPTETWKAGTLFPDVFEDLLDQVYDTRQNVMIHPFLGNITVMVVSWDYEFVGKGPRDGVFIDLTLMETIPDVPLADTISAPSSLSTLANTGTLIDKTLASPTILALTPPTVSLSGFFSRVSSTIKSFISYPGLVSNAINQQVLQAKGGLTALQSAGNLVSNIFPSPSIATSTQALSGSQTSVNNNKNLVSHGPNLNPGVVVFDQQAVNNLITTLINLNGSTNTNPAQLINNAIAFTSAMIYHYQSMNTLTTANLVSALYTYLQQLQTILANQYAQNPSNLTIKQYYVLVPTTLFALCNTLNNTIDQLIQLNSNLGTNYLVIANQQINYYQG